MKLNPNDGIVKIRRRDLLGLVLSAPAALRAQSAARQPSREALLYGGAAPPPTQIELHAGPLSLVFEPETAMVRYVSAGDSEVLRGIYAAVRDRNWGTIRPDISSLLIERESGRFRLSFTATCKAAPIDFVWKGILTGEKDGTLQFDFDGSARSAFLRNRVGFCVLHAADIGGKPVKVEKINGEIAAGRFPGDIAPNQPFFDIRALTHAVSQAVEAEVRMTGDTFEMEDQRNWTDASFKTYCTPLGLPFPVEVKAGDRIRQTVAVRLKGASPNDSRPGPAGTRPVELRLDQSRSAPLPLIGLGVSSVSDALTTREAALLKRIAPAHLRVDVDLSKPDFGGRLQAAADQARALGASLEVALHLDRNPEAELRGLADALAKTKAPVRHYLVFHRQEKSTAANWLELARKHLAAHAPGAKIVAGTDAYFTELNRGRPPLAAADCVTYSINPQVHAFDNLSLVETLEMQAASLHSARKFCGSLPIFVSPVTLRPRFNPDATAAAGPAGPLRELPAAVDARQPSLFAAAWTVGSLKYLAEGGAASVTYYETVGWRGVMESAAGSPLPEKFPSQAGSAFPIYHVLAAAADFRGGRVSSVRSSRKLEVEAVLLRRQGRQRLMIANLTDQPRVVRLVGGNFGTGVRVRMLDEFSAAAAAERPGEFWSQRGSMRETDGGALQIGLLPYAIAFADA